MAERSPSQGASASPGLAPSSHPTPGPHSVTPTPSSRPKGSFTPQSLSHSPHSPLECPHLSASGPPMHAHYPPVPPHIWFPKGRGAFSSCHGVPLTPSPRGQAWVPLLRQA